MLGAACCSNAGVIVCGTSGSTFMQTLPLEQQVTFKGSAEGFRLLLPIDLPWEEVLLQLQQKLSEGERLWQGGFRVALECQNRLLNITQLEQVVQTLSTQKFAISKVVTTRRQTAVAAAVAGLNVEQSLLPPENLWIEPLYIQQSLRSGVVISHSGTVVLIGDIKPGAEVHAYGDIIVWGKVRGLAHAGANGNNQARIFALHLEPLQLRIGSILARAPEGIAPQQPEIAYVRDETIHIALAKDFRNERRRQE